MATVIDPKIAAPSVKSIYVQAVVGATALSSATATILKRGSEYFLVTNRHVVTGVTQDTRTVMSANGAVPDRLVYAYPTAALGTWHVREMMLVDSTYQPLWYEHPVLGPAADFVALRLPSESHLETYAYDIEVDLRVRLEPAEIVRIIGFPFGQTSTGRIPLGVWVTGFVASEPDLDFDERPCFLVDARTRSGMSGSPVIFHNRGLIPELNGVMTITNSPMTDLVGLYSGRINMESDLGLVWKRSALTELIKSIPR